MSGLKDGFYWVKKPDGSKTIVEKEDDRWYYLGSEIEHDYLPDAWEVLGVVAKSIAELGQKWLSVIEPSPA